MSDPQTQDPEGSQASEHTQPRSDGSENTDKLSNNSNRSPDTDNNTEHKTSTFEKLSSPPDDFSVVSNESITIPRPKDEIPEDNREESKQESSQLVVDAKTEQGNLNYSINSSKVDTASTSKSELKDSQSEKLTQSTRAIHANPLDVNQVKEGIQTTKQPNKQPQSPTSEQIITTKIISNTVANPEYIQPRVEFLPIIDVIADYQRGNFLPVLHLLKYNLIQKEFVDVSGYNFLHHAISYNLVEVVLLLLDVFKIDVNIRSKTNQTPLMIASNFGFNEVTKILCDRGAELNAQDESKFTAMLYTVKQGSFQIFAYLLYKNADPSISDANGCNIVHWASYKNNLFWLRLLKRLGFDLWSLDTGGFTPVERAITSDATDTVSYLIEESTKYPVRWKLEEVQNPCIREYLRRKYFKTKLETYYDQAWDLYLKHSKMATFAIYMNFWLIMMWSYLKITPSDLIHNLIFLIFSFYFIAYVGWYFLSSDRTISKLKKFAYKQVTLSNSDASFTQDSISPDGYEKLKNMNFSALNRLIKEDDHEGITVRDEKQQSSYTFPSFLHEVAYLFETHNFMGLNGFECKKYCPTCLKTKAPKSKHCRTCNTCVEHYHHHSYTLGKCIDKTNHVFYLLLLIQQFSLLAIFLWAEISVHNSERKSTWLLLFLETAWLVGAKEGVFFAIHYLLFGIMQCYTIFFLCIEIYGIIFNLTYNEIFNRHRYKYLYEIFTNGNGSLSNVFKNPYDKGIWENVKNYVIRSLS